MHALNAQRSRINRVAYRSQAQRTLRRAKPSTGVWCVQSVSTSSAAASQVEQAPSDKQAVLYTKFKAHDAAVTALAVLKDEPGFKQIVTASLDKSLAVWTLEGGDLSGPQLQCTRMEVSGGPVFSLLRGIKTKVTDANVKPRDPVLFCGLAAKEISALHPDTLAFSQQTRMNGHTGWVRSLASNGKYLFSCGCNHLHQWDQAYVVPKEVRSVSLFTGDILALAATDKSVFTAGADGSLRRWSLGKLGELSEAEVRDKAHDGRITALAVSGSLLFSAGYDGDIKAWDVSSLKLVMEVKGAHAGERVRSLVMGPLPPSSKVSTPSSSTSSSPSGSPSSSPPPSPQPAATASMSEACTEAQQPAVVERGVGAQAPEQPQHHQQPEQQPEQQEPQQQPEEQPQPAAAAADAAPVLDSTSEYDPVPDPQPVPEPPATVPVAVPEASVAEPSETAAAPAPTAEPAPAVAAAPHASICSPSSSRSSSPSSAAVLYSAGDDGMVRRWDARLLSPVGEPLTVHHGAVKALAVGEKEVLLSGDAAGEVAVWLL